MFNIIVISISIYSMFRVFWVWKKQNNWNNKVFDYRINLILNKKWKEHSKYKYTEFLDAIYSFKKMMLYFWVWNIKNMIKNQKLYDIVKEI